MWRSLSQGFAALVPVSIGVAAYGSVLGVLAAQRDIAWWELLSMNLLVFAGSAQFVVVDMWTATLSIAEVALAVAVINLRYVLMCAATHDLFANRSLFHKMTHIHFVADENWAVAMARKRTAHVDTSFLLGGGLCLMSTWCAGTLFGHRLGAVVQNPEAFALDFVFLAMFLALGVSMWRGKKDLAPWIVTVLVSIVAEKVVPGRWYIVIGSVCGALVAAFNDDDGDAGEITAEAESDNG